MNIKGCMMSKRHNWKTPKKLYRCLNACFSFDFDPCPINPDFDGLEVEWGKRNYVNPPYGREIKAWVEKAHLESKKGKVVVMLIPARTDTRYWHEYIFGQATIKFIKGRLCFDDCGSPAPFPSAIVIFNFPGFENTHCISSQEQVWEGINEFTH